VITDGGLLTVRLAVDGATYLRVSAATYYFGDIDQGIATNEKKFFVF